MRHMRCFETGIQCEIIMSQRIVTHINIIKLSLTKNQEQYNREKKLDFSTNGNKITGHPQAER